MFQDGLFDSVDIFLCKRRGGNSLVSPQADYTNVACRIIRDEKVLFAGVISLSDGTVLKCADTNMVYEVQKNGNHRPRGVFSSDIHHSSYLIRIKAETKMR